jgi:hypothetical protein
MRTGAIDTDRAPLTRLRFVRRSVGLTLRGLAVIAAMTGIETSATAHAGGGPMQLASTQDPLPSWNDGVSKLAGVPDLVCIESHGCRYI